MTSVTDSKSSVAGDGGRSTEKSFSLISQPSVLSSQTVPSGNVPWRQMLPVGIVLGRWVMFCLVFWSYVFGIEIAKNVIGIKVAVLFI